MQHARPLLPKLLLIGEAAASDYVPDVLAVDDSERPDWFGARFCIAREERKSA